MAELPLAQGIGRFKQNEDRMDRFTNGTDTQIVTHSDGRTSPTIRKFLKDTGVVVDSFVNEKWDEEFGENLNHIESLTERTESAFEQFASAASPVFAVKLDAVADGTTDTYPLLSTVPTTDGHLFVNVSVGATPQPKNGLAYTIVDEGTRIKFSEVPEEGLHLYAEGAATFGFSLVASVDDDTVSESKLTPQVRALLGRVPVTAEAFGAFANGSNDRAAIQNAAAYAVTNNRPLRLSPGRTYTVNRLTLPDNLVLIAQGAKLRVVGSETGGVIVQIGNSVTIDYLWVSFDGQQRSAPLIAAGDHFFTSRIDVEADTQLGYNSGTDCVTTTGVGTKIGKLVTKNIDYPLTLRNTSLTAIGKGNEIGDIHCFNYLRPFYAIFCEFTRGDVYAVGRSPNADAIGSLDGGRYISTLYEGCENSKIGDTYMEGCGHGARIGGSPHANARTRNITFGDFYLIRPRGCGFKINPNRLVSPGVTEVAENITWGNIYVVDGGDGFYEGNRDIVRLTHLRNGKCGKAVAVCDQHSMSGQTGILLNDVDGLEIEGAHFENLNSSSVVISSTSDVDGSTTFGGPVKNIAIGPISGSQIGVNAVAIEGATYSNIAIELAGLAGFTRLFARFGTSSPGGFFRLSGYVLSAREPEILNPHASVDHTVDLLWKSRIFVGRLEYARWRSSDEVVGNTIDLGVTPADNQYGVRAAFARLASPGDGAYGGSFVLGRPGSIRRGSGIAAKQRGSNAPNVGLVVFTTGTAAVESDALSEHTEFWPNGDMELHKTGRGFILRSPNGTRYKLTVSDNGTLSVGSPN